VAVQASLSFLNISQRFILQACLAVALSLSAMGIKQRVDCCIDHGCDSGISDCCQAITSKTCPGMYVGDFVAVLTYTMQLFQPLNFLGSVYNAIVMAVIDLTNLSELLAQNPDVTDAQDAVPLPRTNIDDEDLAVEFDNVYFHYPTQPSTKGLKGVSFKMKRGTTTAIVGPTGKHTFFPSLD
jgi:ABC-type transport system involved in Fe-S cluster assembly fused permease/ATPase subunit